MPIIPIPWFLAMDVVASWQRDLPRRGVLCLLPLVMVGTNLRLQCWERTTPHSMIAEAKPLMKLVPPEASVCTDNRLILHMSCRAKVYEFNRRHRPKHDGRDYVDADYFLLNTKMPCKPPHKRHDRTGDAREELREGGLKLVAETIHWVLYENKRARDCVTESNE